MEKPVSETSSELLAKIEQLAREGHAGDILLSEDKMIQAIVRSKTPAGVQLRKELVKYIKKNATITEQ